MRKGMSKMPSSRIHHLAIITLVVTGVPLLMGLVGFMVMSAGAASKSVPGRVRITATSGSNSNDYKYVTARCPEGKRLLGAGGKIAGGSGEVEMDDISLRKATSGPPAAVRVYAYETDPYASNWTVRAYAICAFPLVGQELKEVTSAVDSPEGRGVTASCSPGTRLFGSGGRVEGGQGEVLMNFLEVNGSPISAPTSVTVIAHESETYPNNWSVTAQAICASPVTGLVRIRAVSDLADSDNKSVTATCPSGKKVVGTGGRVAVDVDASGELDDYVISAITPTGSSVTVRAFKETRSPVIGQ